MAVSGDAPNITGRRYEATIPDTLDLADRAKLALNGLGGVLDPERDHLMHFFVRYNTQPPYMYHWAYDYENVPKFAESFPLMRAMCGSDLYLEREHKMMSAMVDWLSPDDGLYYSIYRPDRPWHSLGHQGYEQAPEDFANVGIQGRMLRAMLAWRERDPRPEWDDRIRGIVSGLEKVAIHRGGYAYYPDGGFGTAFSYPRSGWRNTDEPLGEDEGGEGSVVAYHGHQLYGLAWWYEVSGDERAVTLARKLARFVMQPRFGGGRARAADGRRPRAGPLHHPSPRALRRSPRTAEVCCSYQRPAGKGVCPLRLRVCAHAGDSPAWMVRLLRRQQPLRLLRRLRLGRHGSLGHQTQRRRPGRLLG